MIKWFGMFIIGLFSFCVSAQAQQGGQFLFNPYHPEFGSQGENIELLDAKLTQELVRYSERGARIQQFWLEYMPGDPQLIEENTFVLKRVMDRTASRIMKSDFFKKTSLGRASENLKDKMQTDVTFKDEKNVSHRFDFKLALFQGQAFVQYEGFTKTQLRYDMSNGGNVAMIFQHDLSPTSTIGIESTLVGDNRAQMVVLNRVW